MMATKPKYGSPVYPTPRTRVLIEHLAELEFRKMRDQLTVITLEAYDKRGIDPEAVLADRDPGEHDGDGAPDDSGPAPSNKAVG